jgi:hypothetical protein
MSVKKVMFSELPEESLGRLRKVAPLFFSEDNAMLDLWLQLCPLFSIPWESWRECISIDKNCSNSGENKSTA